MKQHATITVTTKCDQCHRVHVGEPDNVGLFSEPWRIEARIPKGWHSVDGRWLCSIECMSLTVAKVIDQEKRDKESR